ncbi:hypothetical protein P43SY_007954 [Pythium insidiosum]|uniref:Uncharacterized protein n=1 Tax=Pythium insidiosum TaxID=114742 RepID=A0AAD5LSN4_PYTIN|nr:hypothetical protein P43SY_007954 [Pythium insidiosum]
MKFESGKALVTYVKAYALQTKKEVRVDPKSKGSKTRVILCTEEIYPFKIVAYKSLRLIEAYVEYVRSDFVAKVAELKTWKDAGRIITPRASDAFAQQTQDIGAYKVEKISDDIFHVFRTLVEPQLQAKLTS